MVNTPFENDGWEEYRSLHERAGIVPDHTFISWAPISRAKRQQLIDVARAKLELLQDCDVSHPYYASLMARRHLHSDAITVTPQAWAKTGLSRRVEIVLDLEKNLNIQHRTRDTPTNCEGAW